MSTNNSNKPKLRFKGFSDDWEQRKLGDECNQLTTVINPQNEPNRLFAEYSMPAYDLNKNPDYVLGSTMNSARKVVDRPCLLINKLNVRKQRIWCIEDPEKNAVCSAEFIPVCSEGIDLRFLSYVVSGNAFTSYLEDCSSGSSNSQKRVTPDTIMNAEICIPSRAEQQKIGVYLKDLDHLITLHQYLFSKPSKNKLVHDSIFWEQRKLSDITNVYDGVHQTPDYQESGIMFLSVENIATLTSDKYITQEAFERDYKNYPEKGDILMTRIGDVGTPNVVETVEKVAFYVSLALLKPKNADSYFLCNAICSPEFQRGLKNRTLVTAIPQKINKDEIGKVEFLMPQNTAEQKAIGAYFKNLDHLITLHQEIKYILKEVFIWIILIKRVALKKPLSLNYRIMVGRKRLLSILQNRI